MHVYYNTVAVKVLLDTLPSITFNITDFEHVTPPCVPKVDKCHSFLLFPTCANGITYANPCYAKEACHVDLSPGPCVPSDYS